LLLLGREAGWVAAAPSYSWLLSPLLVARLQVNDTSLLPETEAWRMWQDGNISNSKGHSHTGTLVLGRC